MNKLDLLSSLFSKNRQLPTLPVIFTEFCQLIDSANCSNKRIADLIMKDQSIVSAILKQCNSAMYSNRQEITSVTQAINFLGIEMLKQLILQISLVKIFKFDKFPIPEFNIATFWEHSVSTAFFCEMLVKKLKLPANENYYVAGLLHDIGKLAIYQFYPEKFGQIVVKIIEEQKTDFEAEEEIMGIDHTDIGSYISENWKFKREIYESIAAHHHTTPAEGKLIIPLVRVANMFSKAAGFCFPWDNRALNIVGDSNWQQLVSPLNITIDVERITFEMFDEVERIKESIRLLLRKKV